LLPQTIKPSRWYYGLAVLVLCAGVGIFVFLLIKGLSEITDKLTQMEAPGTAEMTFSEAGKYTIFYERRSVINGKVYDTGDKLSGLWCTVVSKETGEPVQLTQSSVNTRYTFGDRSGVSVLDFNIEKPGVYEVSAKYPDNPNGQKVALAVGTGVTGKIVGTALGGVAVMLGSFALAILIGVLTFVKRRRAKKALTTWPGSQGYPPPYAHR